MKYHIHIVLNQSPYLDENMQGLLLMLNDGWELVNVHNRTDGEETVYLLGRD